MRQPPFKIIMISAMNENGGNTIHRFLDGHRQLFVYPFESQLGTYFVNDYLSSLFPAKYRWPEFPLSGSLDDDYESIIDEELKRHIKTPLASKFKDAEMDFSDKERKDIFLRLLKGKARTRPNIIEAFITATFLSWKDYKSSGKEIAYALYSPIVGVDTAKILSDFPNAQIVHIVRNPYSSFADTKKRPVPYSLSKYIQIWNIVTLAALNFANLYPGNFHIVRFEDLIKNPKKFFLNLNRHLSIEYDNALEQPSWNGKKLDVTTPWGTIKMATPKANKEAMNSLSKKEKLEIGKQAAIMSKFFGYDRL